jgi:hypothetical protein
MISLFSSLCLIDQLSRVQYHACQAMERQERYTKLLEVSII